MSIALKFGEGWVGWGGGGVSFGWVVLDGWGMVGCRGGGGMAVCKEGAHMVRGRRG